MPPRKCVTRVTDAPEAPAREDTHQRPRGGIRKPARTGVQPPDPPRKGDLVEVEWLGGSTVGLVLEVTNSRWDARVEMVLLKDDGTVIRWTTSRVKVLARRRKLRRGACKRRPDVV